MKVKIALVLALALLVGGCTAAIEEAAPPVQREETAAPQEEPTAEPAISGDPLPDIDPARMEESQVVDGWVYFLYPVEFAVAPDVRDARALFRRREDGTELTRLTGTRCLHFDVVDNRVYYDHYPIMPDTHGVLCRIDSGKEEPVMLAKELGFHQVLPPYIYYYHSYDTIGVGIEGHAMYRMNLDGSEKVIIAYETVGPGLLGGHFEYRVEGEWVLTRNFRILSGDPADGTERVELTGPLDPYDESQAYEDDGWFYYTTNRLLRSRPDGSEQQVLDGDDTTWLSIERIEGDWIFYRNQGWNDRYKIRRDGSEKTVVELAPRRE